MTIQEAANELNISLRQAYRDLRHGEESVAALLWPRMRQDEASAGSGSVLPEPTQASALEEEMQRLDKRSFAINLCQLVLRAHKAVDRLAVSLGVQCQVDMPAQPVMVVTDQVVAQQALVSLLSHAIQDAVPGQLSLRLKANGTTALLTVRHHLREGAAPLGTTVAQLADRLHWPLPQVTEGEGIREVLLRIPVGGATILVIDDNEGLGDLFSRYLAGHPFHVIQANNGPDGLDIARQLHPDVIVLDVMMPDLDGWEVLQTLRAEPSTAGIPVIVCSVIDDPQLAQSLGASSSLTKPVGRDDILRVLHALHLT
ncbi:MAG: response regulator [Chloroflexi bacterium]|nr:response regulator [Chloroflexota bacterium]